MVAGSGRGKRLERDEGENQDYEGAKQEKRNQFRVCHDHLL